MAFKPAPAPSRDSSRQHRRRAGCLPVGLARVELATSRLSGVRSNQLSYRPSRRKERKNTKSHFSAPAAEPKLNNGMRRRRTQRRIDLDWTPPPAHAIRDPMAPSGAVFVLRKEVIQPHLPVRLPCYDLAPITGLTLGAFPLAVGTATSGTADFRGLTGGVYKAREHIHRCLLISDY
jgi:hypothetical protein